MSAARALQSSPYISLRTWRKNGRAVDTPVWFAQQEESLFVFSAGEAGKVKRLRRSDRAAVAVCTYSGKVLGPWLEATGKIVKDEAQIANILSLLRQKYGWQMTLTDWGARLIGRFNQRAYLEVSLKVQQAPTA